MRHHIDFAKVTTYADGMADSILGEIYARHEMRRELQDSAARAAGPFRSVPLTVKDDRELWWDDVMVGAVADAMAGNGYNRITQACRVKLIERWPQLDPDGYCSWELTKTTVNHLRFKQCPQCTGFFIGHRTAGVCSDDCRRLWRQRKNTATKRKSRDWWRENRDDLPQDCEHCGVPMQASRSTRRFCSDRCRKAAARTALSPAYLLQ
jgi:hypothetical protein